MKRLLLFCLCFSLSGQALSEKVWTALTAVGTTSGFAVPSNSFHTVQVVITGSPSGCTINLDGSLDGTNWFDLSGGQTCTASVMFHVVNRAVLNVRANLTALSGGTAPTVTARYTGHNGGRIQ